MTKRRIGTIQSFRPGYGAVMPEKASYGKLFAAFKASAGLRRAFRSKKGGIGGKWQGQQGSNPRPAVLETAALPTELYP